MAAGWLSGENLYQAKEPAFSRKQKQFINPRSLYLPDYDENGNALPKALSEDAVLLGRYQLDYPRLECKTFMRFTPKPKEEERTLEEQVADSTPEPKKKRKSLLKRRKETLDVEQYEPEELIEIAERACIIDETDGKYLYDKLTILFGGSYQAVVCDAVDEQPYVSSNINTLLQNSAEVLSALKIVADAAYIKTCFALAYADIDDAQTVIPGKLYEVPVRRVFGRYPIRDRVKKSLSKYGRCYIIGAQALLHLYRAFTEEKAQNTTIITVAGDCVGNPCNIEVRVGTTVREVLEYCGMIKNPARVVLGGSMRGTAIEDLTLPVLYTTRSLLTFSKPIAKPVLNCISCGRCVISCPRKLAPNYLHKSFLAEDTEMLAKLRVDRCIECGVCSYVCPANLELTDCIESAKALMKGVWE